MKSREFIGTHTCHVCGCRVRVYDWLPATVFCAKCARKEHTAETAPSVTQSLEEAKRLRDELARCREVQKATAEGWRHEVAEVASIVGAPPHTAELAACVRAEVERLMRERDEARRELGEILAVIHRDGGHYTGEHGISKSVSDAHTTWAAVVRERDEAHQKERERCARICDAEFAANWHASAMAAANAAKRCAELIRASDEEPHACEPKDSAKHENQ